MQIKLLVDAGGMKPGPALSQKLGPTGINVNQVIQKVNDATKQFAGIKVPVELEIDVQTKNIEVLVSSPPTSGLLKKELGIEKGSGASSKTKVGNLSIEQVISIAKTKYPNLLAKNMKAAVKEVVGTCVSLGILIENKFPNDVQKEIDEKRYDKEISEERTKTPEEKKLRLEKFFNELKAAQEKLKKQEEAATAAATAATAAASPATPAKAPTVGPAAKTPAAAAKPAKPAKGK